MLHDARRIQPGAQLSADLCIVGAGAAGITLARAFLGSTTRICLLESGGIALDPLAQSLAGGENVGHRYFPLAETRLRRLGGTTGWWSGECRPLDGEEDLAPRAWLGHAGWPITKEELAAHYPAAQLVCGLGSDAFDPADAWFAHGGLAPLRLDPQRFVTRIFQFSPPTRFDTVYRQDLERATNIDLLLNATAISVETDPEVNKTTGVRVLSAPGRSFAVDAPIVVLAAGGIENARLLLASNRIRRNGLGNDHDQVGRTFMEHLFFDDVALFTPSTEQNLRPYGRRQRLAGNVIKATLAPTAALLSQAGMLNCCFKLASPIKRHPGIVAAMALRDRLRGGLLRSHHAKAWRELALQLPSVVMELARFAVQGEFGTSTQPRPLLVTVVSEQAPNPDSRVTLSTQRDRLEQLLAKIDWRLGEADRTSWFKGLEQLAYDLTQRGLGRLNLPNAASRDAATNAVRGGCHHIGTTRMSIDPKHGVVDRHCRVHGIQNLFVAGSSVFPTAGHANPTLTIVALALRLAEHLHVGVLPAMRRDG